MSKIAEKLFAESRERLFFLAGPCALESLDLARRTAGGLAEIAEKLGVTLVFKSSFDKANRTSITSFRGPGLETGLEWLAAIKAETGLPVVTDIHLPEQAKPVAEVADVLQIPAFLCRQTDLLTAAAQTQKIVNVKKGQFLAPQDMAQVVNKLHESGGKKIWLTERGSSFGYHNLVVDMRSLPILSEFGCPVIFDATHSVQLPGAGNGKSGGERKWVPVLAKSAVAAGCDGVFMEVHPEPEKALCDGPNSWRLADTEKLLFKLLQIWEACRECR